MVEISGVTVLQKGLETQFFISVGTSSLIKLLLQALIWIVLFSFIPKIKNLKKLKRLKYKNLIILLIAYLLTFSIYAEVDFTRKYVSFRLSSNQILFLIFSNFHFVS